MPLDSFPGPPPDINFPPHATESERFLRHSIKIISSFPVYWQQVGVIVFHMLRTLYVVRTLKSQESLNPQNEDVSLEIKETFSRLLWLQLDMETQFRVLGQAIRNSILPSVLKLFLENTWADKIWFKRKKMVWFLHLAPARENVETVWFFFLLLSGKIVASCFSVFAISFFALPAVEKHNN